MENCHATIGFAPVQSPFSTAEEPHRLSTPQIIHARINQTVTSISLDVGPQGRALKIQADISITHITHLNGLLASLMAIFCACLPINALGKLAQLCKDTGNLLNGNTKACDSMWRHAASRKGIKLKTKMGSFKKQIKYYVPHLDEAHIDYMQHTMTMKVGRFTSGNYHMLVSNLFETYVPEGFYMEYPFMLGCKKYLYHKNGQVKSNTDLCLDKETPLSSIHPEGEEPETFTIHALLEIVKNKRFELIEEKDTMSIFGICGMSSHLEFEQRLVHEAAI